MATRQLTTLVQTLLAITILLYLAGCGGGKMQTADTDFINDSPETVSTAQLRGWWVQAQTAPIDLNAFARRLDPSLPQDLRPSDPRALSIQPRNVEFQVVPNSYGGMDCSQFGIALCSGITSYSDKGPLVRIAQFHDPELFHQASVYELQNVILTKLGYEMKGR